MKTLLLTLALLPTAAAAAYTVGAPHPGTVKATTYSADGSFHGAVDLVSGKACRYWGLAAAVKASLFWDVTIHYRGGNCFSDSVNLPNEAKHTFATGYTFRHLHFMYASATSMDRTCDRCELGTEGSSSGHPTHLQLDKGGTRSTAWYAGTAKGDYLSGGESIGTF